MLFPRSTLFIVDKIRTLPEIYYFRQWRATSKMDQCSSCMLLQMCYLRSHLLLPAEKTLLLLLPNIWFKTHQYLIVVYSFSLMVDNCCAPAQPLMAQLQNMMSGKAVIEPFIP